MLRLTKAAGIFRTSGNRRAIQLPFGHIKADGTVRYRGVELEGTQSMGGAHRYLSYYWERPCRSPSQSGCPFLMRRLAVLIPERKPQNPVLHLPPCAETISRMSEAQSQSWLPREPLKICEIKAVRSVCQVSLFWSLCEHGVSGRQS